MKRNIKEYAIKLTSALFLAAAIMSVGTKVARADEMDTQPTECVETVVEGQGDVIDDQFAVVEGQGDIIDDEFAVAPDAEAQPETVNGTDDEIKNAMSGNVVNFNFSQGSFILDRSVFDEYAEACKRSDDMFLKM